MTVPSLRRAGIVARGPLRPWRCASRRWTRSTSSSRSKVAGGKRVPCFRSHSAHLGRLWSPMCTRQRTRDEKKVPQAGHTELSTYFRYSHLTPCLLRLWLASALADANMQEQSQHAKANTRECSEVATGAWRSRTDSLKNSACTAAGHTGS